MDKSDWVASITCISGCLNGSISSVGSLDDKGVMKSNPKRFFEDITKDGIRVGYKFFSFGQNCIEPAGTQEI